MRNAMLVLSLATILPLSAPGSQPQKGGAPDLDELLKSYQKDLDALGVTYEKLATEQPALRDSSGGTVSAASLEDRRRALDAFGEAARQVASDPHDLSLLIRVLAETETLTDDLSDLSQVCYDNDREEEGNRLADTADSIDRLKHAIESAALRLAEENTERLRSLEKEIQLLQQRLQQIERNSKGPEAH